MKRRVAKATDYASVLCILAFAGWAALPSRVFFEPVGVEIDGTQVAVARNFPFGRQRISYVEQVVSLDTGQSCDTRGGPTLYQNLKPTGTWSIEWAADCLTENYVWSAEWRVWIGPFPLRPVRLERTFP